jgi:hypothetical protein
MPIARAIQRDDREIERWRAEVWPRLKAQACRERRALVLVDESGFNLLPGRVRTYAPSGAFACAPRVADPRPPLGHGWGQADGPDLRPGTSGIAQWPACRRVARAPDPLSREPSAGDLGWLADPSPSGGRGVPGRCRGARCARRATAPYAPDLNPVEGAWQHPKHVELRKLTVLEQFTRPCSSIASCRWERYPPQRFPTGGPHVPLKQAGARSRVARPARPSFVPDPDSLGTAKREPV